MIGSVTAPCACLQAETFIWLIERQKIVLWKWGPVTCSHYPLESLNKALEQIIEHSKLEHLNEVFDK